MDYSKLSDCEIAHMVAQKLPGRYITYPDHVMDSETEEKFDPCNNPADAWPIIIENKINIRFGAEGFHHEAQFLQYGRESVEAYHANPLRAAMIVFLMMQENK